MANRWYSANKTIADQHPSVDSVDSCTKTGIANTFFRASFQIPIARQSGITQPLDLSVA